MNQWLTKRKPARYALALFSLTAALAQNPFTLSEKDEIELGRHAAGEIEKEIILIDDPAITKYISDLGTALVDKSGRPGISYTFKVVNSPEINAFALPGGFIYVNRGLIEAADTQNELAGVLGHEIAHVVARHGATQAARAGLVQTGMGALGALLGGRGTASTVAQMASQMVASGLFMKFSREAEREADRLGARMLSDAKLQPQGMISFFDKLAALQKGSPNAVMKFFSSHPSPSERAQNLSDLVAELPAPPDLSAEPAEFRNVRTRIAALPRPELEAAKAAAAIAAAAVPPTEPTPEVLSRNLKRDREIASRFAPVFHQALGPMPRFDYITNFDFDGDWRGDNNWNNAALQRFPLKGYVYYAVFETPTHFFIHYAAFHPRDYKGGEKGALVSQAMRIGVALGGQYDPTGRASEAVMAHENDLEGALVVAEKNGPDPARARLFLVETLAHNAFLKYVPPGSSAGSGEPLAADGVRPHLFIEPKGHGIEAWRDDAPQHKQAVSGFVVYTFTGKPTDPDVAGDKAVGYDLLPTYDTFWLRARAGKDESFGEAHDYGVVTVRLVTGAQTAERHIKLGTRGSALNGVVGAANMSRPPWGWFDGEDRNRPLGEWFLQPAETIRRRWNLPDSFATAYVYHPFFGQFR